MTPKQERLKKFLEAFIDAFGSEIEVRIGFYNYGPAKFILDDLLSGRPTKIDRWIDMAN